MAATQIIQSKLSFWSSEGRRPNRQRKPLSKSTKYQITDPPLFHSERQKVVENELFLEGPEKDPSWAESLHESGAIESTHLDE